MAAASKRAPPSHSQPDWVYLQVRIRADKEPDLYDLVQALPKGNASHFARLALDAALRSGALTPAGFNDHPTAVNESLQVTLDLERQQRRALEAKAAALEAKLHALLEASGSQPGGRAGQEPEQALQGQPEASPGPVAEQPAAAPAAPKPPPRFLASLTSYANQLDEVEAQRATGSAHSHEGGTPQ